ncbi:MAG: V-type ATPase subunit [Spirochaetes bacterium]|nr:V-type ATPase subunit [Spirochaetota bacterium]
MVSQLRTYGFINAKLRARISKIVTGDILERMIKASSVEEAFRLISDTSFDFAAEVYERTRDLKLVEREVLRKEIGLYLEVENYLKGDTGEFVRTLASRFEIDNLKNALRLFFSRVVRNRPVDELMPYLIREKILHTIAVDEIIGAGSIEEIVEILAETPYSETVKRHKDDVEKERSLFRLEIDLDKLYYQALIRDAKRLLPPDSRTALRLIGIEIDLQNIDRMIRFKTYYDLPIETVADLIIQGGVMLPPGSIRDVYQQQNPKSVLGDIVNRYYPELSGILSSQSSDAGARLLLIERILGEILLYEVRHILQGYPFTIGIILSYFELKSNEIRRVMAILNAKLYNLPEERIRAAL